MDDCAATWDRASTGTSTSIFSSAGRDAGISSSSSMTIGAADEPGSGGGAGPRSVICSLGVLGVPDPPLLERCLKSR